MSTFSNSRTLITLVRAATVNGVQLRTGRGSRFSSTATMDKDDSTEGCSGPKKPARGKTPIGKLDELEEGRHPHQEQQPLPEWPEGVNPKTGERGGPKGPEPTRYGDWERKGRVSDF